MDHISNINPTDLFIAENMQAEDAITNGNESLAAGIIVNIIEKDPSNYRAFNNMGILSWYRKCWADAFVSFKTAVSFKPDYEDALVNLFDAALKLKRVAEVKSIFENALTINPNLEDIRAICNSIASLDNDIYLSKRALSLGFSSVYIEDGKKELESGNYYAAMDKFLKSNDIDGPNAPAFCGLGIISYYQQRYQDAFSLFVESIKLNPSDPETYLNLLDASNKIGRKNAAKEIFTIYKDDFPELDSIANHFDFPSL